MNTVKAVWKDGQIIPDGPVDWPDGCEVLIEPISTLPNKIGLDETEWRDDPASLVDWGNWIATLQPLQYSPQEVSDMARFDEQMRRYNIEAVTRQMEDTAK